MYSIGRGPLAVLWEANPITPFSRLTQSLIFNEWSSENGSGDKNGQRITPKQFEI
jgi:hypothetical protein